MKSSLDDITDEILRDETAAGEAIRSLIKVDEKKAGKDSDIELKTDLSADEVKIHSVIDILGKALESNPEAFAAKSIFPIIVEKIERKLLSKERKSREEIVAVARQPDNLNAEFSHENEGAFRRFFMGRRNNV